MRLLQGTELCLGGAESQSRNSGALLQGGGKLFWTLVTRGRRISVCRAGMAAIEQGQIEAGLAVTLRCGLCGAAAFGVVMWKYLCAFRRRTCVGFDCSVNFAEVTKFISCDVQSLSDGFFSFLAHSRHLSLDRPRCSITVFQNTRKLLSC